VALGAGVGYNLANVGPAADVVAQAYGVRLGAIGFLATALFVTHLTLQIPGGRLVDRRGARKLGMFALGAAALGNAIALIAPSFALGVLARLVTGVGTGIGFVAGSDYVRSTVGTPSAQGVYGASGIGGAGLAIAIVPLATPALDWRAPYVTALVFASGVLVCMPLAPRDQIRRRRDGTGGTSLSEIVHDRRLYPLAVAHAASFGLSVIAGTWAVALLQHDGYGRRLAGAVAALTLLAGLITRPLGGWLVERFPQNAARLVCASMLFAAGGTVLFLLDLPLAARVVGAALLGLSAGIPFAPAFAGAQLIRRDRPAAATGFVNSCATFVILVGTPLVGLTFALPDEGRAGFAAVAVAWIAASVAVRPSKLSVLRRAPS
jgi:MFS family permease